MPPSHFVLLYVDRPEESARFYERVLERKPLELSPTFAMFALREGVMLGLWSKHTVEPATEATATFAPGRGRGRSGEGSGAERGNRGVQLRPALGISVR